MNWTIRVHVNIDFGGYVEVNSLYFLFMEQMHWQFISYSCSLPSGIHLYKLERYTRCLPFSYAWLSYGHHNHNHNPIYTVWSSQHAFEEENSNYSQFPRAKGGLGAWAGCPMSQEVHPGSLSRRLTMSSVRPLLFSVPGCVTSVVKHLTNRNQQIPVWLQQLQL